MIRFLLLITFISIGSGCSARNLYKNVKQQVPPPLERGYSYSTHDKTTESGSEPVEFGSVLATDDTVYVASETKGLEAFERTTFIRKWGFYVKNGISSSVTLKDRKLYFGANDGTFYALNAEFGKVVWQYETRAPVFAKPTLEDNKVLVHASDDVLYCLNASTGEWIWHYKRSGNYITTIRGNSSPIVVADMVLVGFSDGYIVALNWKDGNLKWEQKIHAGNKFTDVDASPVVENNTIFIPSYDGSLYALQVNSGKVIWRIDVGGSRSILIDDQVLYVPSSSGFVYAVQKETGRVVWKFELDRGTPTKLILKGSYLAFGSSQQYFYTIYKGNGKLAYRHSIGSSSGFTSNPFQLNNQIYVLSNFGNVYVFRWL